MTHVRLTYAERGQVEALDELCALYNLTRGKFTRGGKHGRYTIALPNGRDIYLTISCTPRELAFAIQRNETNFRHNVAKAMGWIR